MTGGRTDGAGGATRGGSHGERGTARPPASALYRRRSTRDDRRCHQPHRSSGHCVPRRQSTAPRAQGRRPPLPFSRPTTHDRPHPAINEKCRQPLEAIGTPRSISRRPALPDGFALRYRTYHADPRALTIRSSASRSLAPHIQRRFGTPARPASASNSPESVFALQSPRSPCRSPLARFAPRRLGVASSMN